jgi:peptidoglycan/LPS O-acetylase OafA/YrhL
MDSHASYLQKRHFGSLDGLRAISITAVIWHHTAPKWSGAILGYIGTYGVHLFFAISGFLITTLLLRERSRKGSIDLTAFYLRRTLRIFPLYFGVLAIYIVLVAFLEQGVLVRKEFFNNLIYFATYTSNLFVKLDGRVIFYFAWSLATEEQFYLIWPSILSKTETPSRAVTLLTVVLMVCISDQLLGTGFLSAIPVAIVGGALLATALHTERGFDLLKLFLGQRWSIFALILALVLLIVLWPPPEFIIHLLFVLIVGASVIRENHPLRVLFSCKPVRYIGSISYGMYMFHMLCEHIIVKMLEFLRWDAIGIEVFVLTFLLSVVVARLSFTYFESFFLNVKHKFER